MPTITAVPVRKLFAFAIDDDLKAGLSAVRERDGVSESEQARRALRAWLTEKGVLKAGKQPAKKRKK
jgi:hypothetical protein